MISRNLSELSRKPRASASRLTGSRDPRGAAACNGRARALGTWVFRIVDDGPDLNLCGIASLQDFGPPNMAKLTMTAQGA